MIQCKRVYDPQESSDGYRVLVDRLWPRGIKKEALACDEWCKELTPSAELRKAFHGEAIDGVASQSYFTGCSSTAAASSIARGMA